MLAAATRLTNQSVERFHRESHRQHPVDQSIPAPFPMGKCPFTVLFSGKGDKNDIDFFPRAVLGQHGRQSRTGKIEFRQRLLRHHQGGKIFDCGTSMTHRNRTVISKFSQFRRRRLCLPAPQNYRSKTAATIVSYGFALKPPPIQLISIDCNFPKYS